MTEDRTFLRWVHARLRDQHAENPNYDYMHKLIAIAEALPEGVDTPWSVSPVPADCYYMPPIKLGDGEVLIAFTRKQARRMHKAADDLVWAIGMSSAFLKMPKVPGETRKQTKAKFMGNPVIFDEAVKADEIVFANDEYHIKERFEPGAYPPEPPPAPDPATDPYTPMPFIQEIPLSAEFGKKLIDAIAKMEKKAAKKLFKGTAKVLDEQPTPVIPVAPDRNFVDFKKQLAIGGIDNLATEIHEMAKSKGWYDADPAVTRLIDTLAGEFSMTEKIADIIRNQWPRRNLGEQLFLIVSELVEAFEEYRAGRPINEVYEDGGKPEGVPVEIADAIIRILDLTSYHGIGIGSVIRDKVDFNATRPHRHGGKLA